MSEREEALRQLIELQCDNFATGTQDRDFLRDDEDNEPYWREMLRLNLEQFAKSLARTQPQQEPVADTKREVLMDKSLRQYAHELRREACAAWSAVIGKGDIDEAKCQYAGAIEKRLKCAIDELADLSSPPAQGK